MIIISPAKKLNFLDNKIKYNLTMPAFRMKAEKIVSKLKKLKPYDVKNLMGISDNLSKLNYQRFQSFSSDINVQNSRPAIFAFAGDTYSGLSSENFNDEEIMYAQKNLRILSGLYGVLRPLDQIQPYRLEMGTKTNEMLGESLYDFWTKDITKNINEGIIQTKSKYLFNLSSSEYFKSINFANLNCKVVTPFFYVKKNGKLKPSGMFSKKCRGSMAKMIIQKRITEIEQLFEFNDYGYVFESHDLKDNRLIFIKNNEDK